ncbi:hypothetical protein C6P46_003301 [Rhodotorula mucilaginosa]|uniref:Uncharacterized protein n=1 Tax=Rhodotorula mucilaginosa TaxID=5537 RepID=A0A9P7B6J0_RHOMI|nr:hypothetical protein C6P46_003301 [Rhodotorula mucilaginosa]
MASRLAVSSSKLLLARATPRRAAAAAFSSSRLVRAEPTPEPSTSSSPPPPPAAAKDYSPKVAGIVDQISTLTLLEAADLVDALKSRLNIVDIAMPAAAPAAAAAPAGGAAEEPEKAAPKEKTVFNVNLTKIDAAQKAKAIKEAKKFVESLPKTLKENATKDEADKLAAAFKAIGAEVSLD